MIQMYDRDLLPIQFSCILTITVSLYFLLLDVEDEDATVLRQQHLSLPRIGRVALIAKADAVEKPVVVH